MAKIFGMGDRKYSYTVIEQSIEQLLANSNDYYENVPTAGGLRNWQRQKRINELSKTAIHKIENCAPSAASTFLALRKTIGDWVENATKALSNEPDSISDANRLKIATIKAINTNYLEPVKDALTAAFRKHRIECIVVFACVAAAIGGIFKQQDKQAA